MLLDCMYVNVKYYLICVKLFKNAIKICYSKRQCVSASGDFVLRLRPWTLLGDFRPPDPLASAVLKFPLKIPCPPKLLERPRAENCNFWKLQISDIGDMGAQNLDFPPIFPRNRFVQPSFSLSFFCIFWTKIFRPRDNFPIALYHDATDSYALGAFGARVGHLQILALDPKLFVNNSSTDLHRPGE